MPTHKPFIIVVTGRPGSGKTTLVHHLANRVHCPVLCRDEFKEGYVHTMGSNHASLGKDVNWRIYETFFETVDFVISKGVSLVIEAAFQHKLWEPKLLPLIEVATVSIIVCLVDPQLARSRFVERRLTDPTRERFHGDREGRDLPAGQYNPPELNVPTLRVDTTDGYEPDMEQIITFVMQSQSRSSEAAKTCPAIRKGRQQ